MVELRPDLREPRVNRRWGRGESSSGQFLLVTRVVDNPALTAQPLCHSLAAAVQRLEAKSDADYGTIPKASFELAARLEDCAASSP